MKPTYQPETAGAIMTNAIPSCSPTSTREEVIKQLAGEIEWEDVHHVYVVDQHKKALGYLRIRELVRLAPADPIKIILRPIPDYLRPEDDQEKAVFLAVKNNTDNVPVLDEQGRLLGAVTAKQIIDIMHNEHVEDSLLSVGIRRGKGSVDLLKLAEARIAPVIFTRAPWLIVGALVGVGLGFVASWFEGSIEKTIALAYFVPVVAYIADSVGTQSEAITVRALATLKLSPLTYMLREIMIGMVLGVILGTMGLLGAWAISQSWQVATVVGLSLLFASILATCLASLIPLIFKKLGKDPALGSGPIATALQDVLSIVIYFVVAKAIIG